MARTRRRGTAHDALSRGHPHGDDPVETFDLFEDREHAGEALPLLVFIHGGYWRSLSNDDFSWIAPAFVARGGKVAVVGA